MPATFVLPVTSLVYAVSSTNNMVVLSSVATSTNEVGTVTQLVTASLVPKFTGLWIDQELMQVMDVLSDPAGVKYQVRRGLGGSAVHSHSSTAQVTIGTLDKFYSEDPKGRPLNTVLVSPWINTFNGNVWMPQGDAGPGGPVRWWQNVTNTYGIGPLGVRTQTSNPTFGT